MSDPALIFVANMASVPMGLVCAFAMVEVRERVMAHLHRHAQRRVLHSEFRKIDEWIAHMKKPAEAGFPYRCELLAQSEPDGRP